MAVERKINWNLVIIAAAALIALGLFGWTNATRSGEIRGVVVDASGAPVEGATVRLREKTLNLIKEGLTTTTDSEGRYRFTDQAIIEFFLDAAGPEGRRSEEVRYHLYFPGQDFSVPDPLVLDGPVPAE
jgi:hypothetical protein